MALEQSGILDDGEEEWENVTVPSWFQRGSFKDEEYLLWKHEQSLAVQAVSPALFQFPEAFLFVKNSLGLIPMTENSFLHIELGNVEVILVATERLV